MKKLICTDVDLSAENISFTVGRNYFLINGSVSDDDGKQHIEYTNIRSSRVYTCFAEFVVVIEDEKPLPELKETCSGCGGVGWIMIDVGQLENCNCGNFKK